MLSSQFHEIGELKKMNSILKKTLLAVAVGGCMTANAATLTAWNNAADTAWSSAEVATNGSVTGTGAAFPLVSAEGYKVAQKILIGTANTDLGVRWAAGVRIGNQDIVTLEISGATITTDTTPTLTAVTAVANGVNDGLTTSVLGLVNQTATSLTFRSEGVIDANGTYELQGVTLTNASGAVTVKSISRLSGTDIEVDAGSAKTAGLFASEFLVTNAGTSLNGEVDVAQQRKQFTGTTDAARLTDDVIFNVESGADLMGVTLTHPELTLKGEDFAWLYNEKNALETAKFLLQTNSGNTDLTLNTTAGNTGVNEAQTEVKFVSATNQRIAGDNLGVKLTVDGVANANAQVLTAQTFSADVKVNYTYNNGNATSSDAHETTGLAAGQWKLSGKTVNIPFMPYNRGVISQVIHVSNDGNVAGDIELTAFDDSGKEYGPVTLDVEAAAKTVTRLNNSIERALTAEGFDFFGNLDITLVINSPDNDIEAFAAYNVKGDRISVPVQ